MKILKKQIKDQGIEKKKWLLMTKWREWSQTKLNDQNEIMEMKPL